MLDATRLKTNIYNTTKSELKARFDVFKTGLQSSEQTLFDQYLDKLAQAIGYGDGPETVTEITGFAVVNVSTPNVMSGGDTKPGTGGVS